MIWNENCIILSSSFFSEKSRMISFFSKTLGRSCGIYPNIKTPVQKGDISEINWRGRTGEHLGTVTIENLFSPFTYVFRNALKIFAIDSVCSLCSIGLPIKAPHEKLFNALESFLLNIVKDDWLTEYVFFELTFLAEMGNGLDLSKCAVTGSNENLFYISPRTGRSVCRDVGKQYKDKLFLLPKFLIDDSIAPTSEDICYALHITEHFLKAYFCGISDGGELPMSRKNLALMLGEEKNENQRAC